jgi:hypothetical protein
MARCCQGDDEKTRIACCWTRMFGGWCLVRLYLVCCVVCSNKLSSPADGTIRWGYHNNVDPCQFHFDM